MTDKWLYLNTVRNPHLVLAEALQDTTGTEVQIQVRHCSGSTVWRAITLNDTGILYHISRAWNRVRIQRRLQSDELGPCQVCGGRGIPYDSRDDMLECEDCGLITSGDAWKSLRLVEG